ncbi:MAG: RDD family protein [Actinomycetota bacterium]
MSEGSGTPPGWYYAQGDPPGTQRYWDGAQWVGEPEPVGGAEAQPGYLGGTPMAGVAGLTPAGAGARIGGRIIDWILWIIVGSIINAVIIGSTSFQLGTDTGVSFARTALAGIIGALIVGAYEAFMVGSRGATLGKMVTSTKVVKPDGSPADLNTGIRRIGIYVAGTIASSLLGPIGGIFALVVLVVGIAGLVMLFTDNQRQTVWDKVAPSIVVSSK